MDLFYTLGWMEKHGQQQKQQPLTEFRMFPSDETRNMYIMTRGREEIARFDLKERGPGEVFKSKVTQNGNVFFLETC